MPLRGLPVLILAAGTAEGWPETLRESQEWSAQSWEGGTCRRDGNFEDGPVHAVDVVPGRVGCETELS